ncbi:MAG: family 78 glycoside hydrolase catalytic domain [Clostridia bacterium]|nr:family 78 glycoside hydrolase catalytic domain [Clostridia bacterium]
MLRIRGLLLDYEAPECLRGVEKLPNLGWVLESDGRNVRQAAYQWQLSETEDFSSPLHDSGRVESDESAHVPVPETALHACRKYFIRARVWTEQEESDWAQGSFLTGMTNGPWQAKFITAEGENDWVNSKGTYLRKTWRIEKPVKEAYVCATALGLYHLYLNGEKVNEEQFLPGWTSYHDHLCYQIWDVTPFLHPDENVLGAHVGAGWYKGMMGFVHERCAYGDRTAFMAQLIIRYQDGTEETVVTDESWLGCASPVTFSEIYDGERYDARLEQTGWNAPGFAPQMGGTRKEQPAAPLLDRLKESYTEDEKKAQRRFAQEYRPADTLWRPAQRVDFPLKALSPQASGRPAVEKTLPVREILKTPKGETVLDFGQNLTGHVRFTLRGKAGALAHIRCFETLDAAGNAYFDNLRGALAEIRYICRDGHTVTYDEQFSFQGFRYALIQEWPEEIKKENFCACVIHSQMMETGHFVCSNPLLNQLENNIEWSLRGNFLDIPTDCPQRDERMGWTGDAQIFCRTASFLRNTYAFYRKWLRDVALDQQKTGGGVPHMVPNQLQYFPATQDWLLSQGIHSAAAWADVAVILPWTLYLTYGDTRVLRDQFDSMKAWIDFMRDHAKDFIWNYKLQFGDWVALDAADGSYWGATPNDLTCTAYFAYSTGLFVKICRVLEMEALAREYEALYSQIADKFQRTFLDDNGVMAVQTQTAHIVALYFHLVPEKGIPGTVEGLKKLLQKENGHLVTGFVGTPYFCHALSQNGCKKEAYDLLLKEDFPSWLYQVKAGATTIWEHWDGLKPDGTMWSPDMNSFNHYAYGAIGEWLYRAAAGLEIDEARPGYRHAVIAPLTGGDLSWAQGEYDSVYGPVSSHWTRENGKITLTVRVPANASASIILEQGAENPESELRFTRNSQGQWQAETGSGTWTVTYLLNE